ncbi:hypothetical protein ACFLZM_00820, partial [Thermodesulfobacteriota bacterium]
HFGLEDLLFILLHERDHLILRKLYPQVVREADFPKDLLNFAEDVFINAIARRHVPSILPERFYDQSMEMLLTGMHDKIDWHKINYEENGLNVLKEAHGAMYSQNYALLHILNQRNVNGGSYSGYQEWMELMYRWHRHMQDRKKTDFSEPDATNADEMEQDDTEPEQEDDETDVKSETESEEPSPDNETEEPGQDSHKDSDDLIGGEPCDEAAEDPDKDIDDDHGRPVQDGGDRNDSPIKQEEGCRVDANDDTDDEPPDPDMEDRNTEFEDIGTILKRIIPIVQDDINIPQTGSHGELEGDGLQKIPIPDLTPGDPVTRMILYTSDLPDFRNRVRVFEDDMLDHVEGLIHGILSDRATERSYDGYSVPIPLAMTRRDAFCISAGVIPVLWQRQMGVERPNIDLYVDVSGSMNQYYIFIPYIYDSLRHVIGRIFQFSTRIVEVDHDNLFLHTTGGTSFECVADHMIEQQIKSAILLSDGESGLSDRSIETLKKQLDQFVYIKIKDNSYKNWEHIAHDIILLESATSHQF